MLRKRQGCGCDSTDEIRRYRFLIAALFRRMNRFAANARRLSGLSSPVVRSVGEAQELTLMRWDGRLRRARAAGVTGRERCKIEQKR